jgi:hypothetical protein
MDLFAAKKRIPPEHIEKIRAAVRAKYSLTEDAVIMVSELRCTEPGCPPLETVIAILEEGARRQFKIHKAAIEIGEEDIRELTS